MRTCSGGVAYAGVRCIKTTDVVRLVGGATKYEGRVEVKINKLWGTICNKEWSLPNVDVICRQLGFPRGAREMGGAWFGKGAGTSNQLFVGNKILLLFYSMVGWS